MSRVERWERGSEWWLAALAVIFLVAYAIPILWTHAPGPLRHACATTNFVVWLVFVVDYVVRLAIAKRRVHYVGHHLADMAMVALPALRPLRLLRLLMLLRVLNRRAADSLHGRVAAYVTGAFSILILCASLAVLDAERGQPGANIHDFGTAVWWSLVTVSTVGYGDHFPVTGSGRLVGAGLMLGGVALLGVVTATFASWLVDRVREAGDVESAATRADLARLSDEIATLRSLVETQQKAG